MIGLEVNGLHGTDEIKRQETKTIIHTHLHRYARTYACTHARTHTHNTHTHTTHTHTPTHSSQPNAFPSSGTGWGPQRTIPDTERTQTISLRQRVSASSASLACHAGSIKTKRVSTPGNPIGSNRQAVCSLQDPWSRQDNMY